MLAAALLASPVLLALPVIPAMSALAGPAADRREAPDTPAFPPAPAPVQAPASAQTPRPVQESAPVQAPASVQVLATVQALGPAPGPAPGPASDVAFANPRSAPLAVVSLPRPLDAGEAEQVKRVLALRAHGRLGAAEQEAAALAHSPLAGPVEADLLLARDARAKTEALQFWLARFADQPDAPAIYELLLARLRPMNGPPPGPTAAPAAPPQGAAASGTDGGTGQPPVVAAAPPPVSPAPASLAPISLASASLAAVAALPPPPTVRALGRGVEYALPPDPPDPLAGPMGRPQPKLEQAVERRADAGDGAGALALIEQAQGLEPLAAGRLRGQVVLRLFLRGDDAAAQGQATGIVAGSTTPGLTLPDLTMPGGGMPGQMTAGQMTAGQMTAGEMTAGPATAGLAAVAGLAAGSTAGGQGALPGRPHEPAARALAAHARGRETRERAARIASEIWSSSAIRLPLPIAMPPPIPLPPAFRAGSALAADPTLPTPAFPAATFASAATLALSAHRAPAARSPSAVPAMAAAAPPVAVPGGPDGTGLAGLAGGLAAWRAGRIAAAVPLFEAAWATRGTPRDVRVAGAFWAARAHGRLGDAAAAAGWMRLAANHPLSFYGMIARRALGLGDGFAPPPPARRPAGRAAFAGSQATLGEADVAAVDALPGGHRAFALLQVGLNGKAETELRCLWESVGNDPDLRRSLLLVTRRAGLAAAATQMADALAAGTGSGTAKGAAGGSGGAVAGGAGAGGAVAGGDPRFPVPALVPRAGYAVPPALVYGVTLLESGFDPQAVSSTNARGLMQLMPATAVEVAGDPALAGADGERLHDPMLNLELGQRFLLQLGRMPQLEGDLIRVLASYYSGPTAVGKWADGPGGRQARDAGDPLLFLEAIPADDVRGYVRRGLLFTWTYAARFRLPAPGLDDLAAGRFPRFTALAVPQAFLPPHLRP